MALNLRIIRMCTNIAAMYRATKVSLFIASTSSCNGGSVAKSEISFEDIVALFCFIVTKQLWISAVLYVSRRKI